MDSGSFSDSLHKFGSNFAISTTNDPQDVWTGGGLYPFPSTANATTIVSTNAADASPSGDGARTVKVQGLDANYVFVTETVALNGLTPVALSTQYLRVFRMSVETVGAGATGTNVGNINVAHGATTIAQIAAGLGQTLMAIYTVPDNYTLRMAHWYCTLATKTDAVAVVALQVRPYGGAWQTKEHVSIGRAGWSYDFHSPIRYAAGTDMRVRVLEVSANDSGVDAGFDAWLFQNE